MKTIRQLIGLLGLCPSCLHYQGIFTFTDYVCLTCHENEKDGGGLKKIFVSILALIASYFGYGEYSEQANKITELQGQIQELSNRPEEILGGVQDKDGDGRITKWDKDTGLPALYNPKYWSQ